LRDYNGLSLCCRSREATGKIVHGKEEKSFRRIFFFRNRLAHRIAWHCQTTMSDFVPIALMIFLPLTLLLLVQMLAALLH
jgi:hypothetical protein